MREFRPEALRKFAALPPGDRRLLCRAAVLLIAAEVLLRCRPRRTVRSLLSPARQPPEPFPPACLEQVPRLARLMTIADTHGPLPPSCLRRCVAMAWWLRRRRVASHMKISVAKDARDLRAHAWLEVAGRDAMPVFEEPGLVDLRFAA